MLDIALNLGFLIASLAVLLYIADKLIDRSVRLARILGVSGIVIGLTLLAYGTSMPELAVSTIASFQTHEQLSVSNIIGSNIFNIAVIMGISAILIHLRFKKENPKRDGLFMMATTIALIPLAFLGGISGVAGILMVALLILYTYYVIKSDRRRNPDGGPIKREKGSAKKEFGLCCILLACILIAGNFVVQFAVATARLAGISEWIIGSTIVAAGTSMPETVVSIVSAKKKQMGMSLGNIIGSNYFNIFWILGLSAAIRPLSFSIINIWLDLAFLLVITSLFYIALIKKSISRAEGVIYLAIYTLYLLHLLGVLGF